MKSSIERNLTRTRHLAEAMLYADTAERAAKAKRAFLHSQRWLGKLMKMARLAREVGQ